MVPSTLELRRATKGAVKEQPDKHLRLDIQGLRAIAVGTVLLYHAGMPWLPGGFIGVDIFFVISGFLITGGIVRELKTKGKFSLSGFYARRAARILPAATVAMLGVIALSLMLLPITRWAAIGRDAVASMLYFVNWLFAGSAVDYMAKDQAPSPFQHFWSLSVEEQFYIFWPLLLMLAAWLAVKFGKSKQGGFLIVLVVVAIPSLAWSIYMTDTNPGGAYFATTARTWELAIGAGLAIASTLGSRVPRRVAAVIGWAGIGAIAWAAMTYTSSVPFPSFTALVPTLGAAAVIWAGPHAGKAGPVAFLGVRPMVVIGGLSYSLYLWHWPLLVIAAERMGPLSPAVGLAIVGISFIPAWLSLKFIEKPVLNWSKKTYGNKPSLQMGGLTMLVSVTAAIMLILAVPPVPPAPTIDMAAVKQLQKADGQKVEPTGAEVLFAKPDTNTAVDSFKTLTPAVLSIKDDVPIVNRNGCMQGDSSFEAVKCSFGDQGSKRVITLVGDSHAAMVIPGLSAMGLERGFRVDTYTKGACPFVASTVEFQGKPYDSCRQWVDNVTKAVLQDGTEAVVTAMSRYRVMDNGSTLGLDESVPLLANGLQDAWKPFVEQKIPVFSLRDAPRPDTQVADCIAQNENKLTACSWPKDSILAQDPPEVIAVGGTPDAKVIDLTPAYCPQVTCPSVIGGVVVYRDGNHLTASFAQTLSKHFGAAMESILK